jgi:hypothetical protein
MKTGVESNHHATTRRGNLDSIAQTFYWYTANMSFFFNRTPKHAAGSTML